MSRARWRLLRGRLLAALLRPLAALLGRSSLAGAQRVGRWIGRAAWLAARRDRRRAREHLALALPELGTAERRRIAREAIVHQGVTFAETLHLTRRSCADVERYVDAEGWQEVQAHVAAGRPVMIITGHCGNWELLAALANCRGLALSVVGRQLDEPDLQQMLLAARRRFGTETIERGAPGSSRRLLRVLRDGGALGMLIDQDTKVEGVWVDFFGRPAHTPVGAARIALKVGAAVVPTFIERRPDGRHLARFLPALHLPADPTEATALMTAAIESQVRRVPEQWVWMHRRWRTRPA